MADHPEREFPLLFRVKKVVCSNDILRIKMLRSPANARKCSFSALMFGRGQPPIECVNTRVHLNYIVIYGQTTAMNQRPSENPVRKSNKRTQKNAERMTERTLQNLFSSTFEQHLNRRHPRKLRTLTFFSNFSVQQLTLLELSLIDQLDWIMSNARWEFSLSQYVSLLCGYF